MFSCTANRVSNLGASLKWPDYEFVSTTFALTFPAVVDTSSVWDTRALMSLVTVAFIKAKMLCVVLAVSVQRVTETGSSSHQFRVFISFEI